METQFDGLRALGTIPSSHAHRLRFLPKSESSVVGTIDFGVLFIMAFWSGSSIRAFEELKRVLAKVDPDGRLELVVVDTDGCSDVYNLPEFLGKIHGSGETAWIKHGKIVSTSGMGFRPERFEPCTLQLLNLQAQTSSHTLG